MLFFTLTMRAHCCHSRILLGVDPQHHDATMTRAAVRGCEFLLTNIEATADDPDQNTVYPGASAGQGPIRTHQGDRRSTPGCTGDSPGTQRHPQPARHTQRDPLNPGETAFVTDTIHREKLRTPATWDNTAGRGRY
jgi:hypothetical protein